jgi:hypothetical protein
MVIRDLTLRSAASFGSFHLIRLLYDEYMFYLVENRVAEATGETPIAVMGEVSAACVGGLGSSPTPLPYPSKPEPQTPPQALKSCSRINVTLTIFKCAVHWVLGHSQCVI